MFQPDTDDPLALFARWYEEAGAAEPGEPNAMSLVSVDADGRPSVRIVLLKGFDARGFVFYTNLDSRKGRELRANAHAALGFHWKSLGRQVRIEGPAALVAAAEADAYFASRPRGSRIGAWASQQSEPIADRAALLAAVGECERRFPGEAVPRPPHWSGFRVRPLAIEFWQSGEFRLHDRFRFCRPDEDAPWSRERLQP